MFAPGTHTEAEVFAGFIATQLEAVRAAAFGLTDEQARQRPCRSELSVGGVVKHVTWVMRQRGHDRVMDAAGFASFTDSFTLREDETLAGTLATFDEVRATYLADVRATDPAAAMTEPPAPWDGRPEPTPSVHRYALAHAVEEFARHAGHADVLREQLDGATALPLLLAAHGIPGNAFASPWTPPTD
ncbi:Protein of unknown function [Quadrisphaera granulorum]|uniref:Uncharacterized protein DUF664 n=1 Tax=Quadrisphaera granulorum TaxID=317664 RepID=A0A316A4E7_9ACTN|nr:DUF664 domain-containing protein [Quadrisphaera granulorum]PWJ51810.1 uncharacterized protein DUF664 [Quadrisphaera granulorum]SZE97757.1 Protein of unknown function [Quadrisphaera granulorum]